MPVPGGALMVLARAEVEDLSAAQVVQEMRRLAIMSDANGNPYSTADARRMVLLFLRLDSLVVLHTAQLSSAGATS